MQYTKRNKMLSVLLSILMILSVWTVPASAFADEGISVTLQTAEITPGTSSVSVNLSRVPDSGILRVIEMDAGESYDSAKLNSYTNLHFSVVATLKVGGNTLALTAKPTVGKKIMVVLRDASGSEAQDYTSSAVTVKAAESGGSSSGGSGGSGQTSSKTEAEILKNCGIEILQNDKTRTEKFRETETSTQVKVKLDDSVDQCYMKVYAYPGNAAFDPDGTVNKTLYTKTVTNGETVDCNFKQTLIKGYKIVACLIVPVGNDNYKTVTSQTLEIVDENGEGFQDYDYPDISIDETELTEGATTLHVSMTGDERLFKAAKAGKTEINWSIGQYPDGEDFDFEGDNQIALVTYRQTTEAFQHMEVKLSQPLKAGYRVRAVAYWDQNADIFLPKGNDYEKQFGKKDDSVLIKADPAKNQPTAAVSQPLLSSADSIDVTLGGTIPEGSILLLKRYDGSATSFATTEGTPLGVISSPTADKNTLTLASGTELTEGQKVVAFLLNSGNVAAQSQPVTVTKAQDFTITKEGSLTAGMTKADFRIVANDSSIENINIVALCRVNSEGMPNTVDPIARAFGKQPGLITFDNLSSDALRAGDKVCLVLTYKNGNAKFISDTFTVAAPLEDNSLAIQEDKITTDTETVTVAVKGCSAYKDGYLFLTTGSTATIGDADSRAKVGTKTFTGEGTYTFTISKGALKAGETLQPHLYIYDSDNDKTNYKYGEALTIQKAGGTVTKKAKTEIVTDNVTADRKDVWVSADFDSSLTGTLKLYTYDGDAFDEKAATQIASQQVKPQESSQKISFGSGKLMAGKKLIAVLELSDGTSVTSAAKTIKAAPEKAKPKAQILDREITAGDTKLKASMTFDESVSSATYTLYQYEGETLDTDKAKALSSGSLYRSDTNRTIYLGQGRIKVGSKLQLVLTTDGQEARSNVMTVQPSPDWGDPYGAFDVSAVKEDATSIPVTIDYFDEYLSLGDDFYCDVSVYQFSAEYTDQEFEDNELWENFSKAKVVAKANSRRGDVTKGQLNIPLLNGASLKAGERLIIKLRLPHTEWEGEEVDYIFASVPVIGANDEVPAYKVVLYNLGTDSSRGERLHGILEKLSIPAEEIKDENLNETVGYLAGLKGYEAAGKTYEGKGSQTEFMLLCNLPESLLDRFLAEMTAENLRINHKAVVTEYNREAEFHELIDEIGGEHDVFQALLDLDAMIRQAEKLTKDQNGKSPAWSDFEKALTVAKKVLSSEEPGLSDLQKATAELKKQYLEVTGMKEIQGSIAIDIEQDASGTYTVKASTLGVDGKADVETTYDFLWNDGTKGDTLKNIPADKLITYTVTATAKDRFGSLKAGLQVPDKPRAEATVSKDGVKLTWKTPKAEQNKPLPTSYKAVVYDKDGKAVTEATCDGAATFLQLDVNTSQTYTIKFWAISPVGRSDMQTLTTAAYDSAKDPAQPSDPAKNNGGQKGDPAKNNANASGAAKADASAARTGNADTAKTGDESQAGLLAALALLAVAGAGAALHRRRKEL